MLVDAMRTRHGVGCARIDAYYTAVSGALSGGNIRGYSRLFTSTLDLTPLFIPGTLASMLNIFNLPPEDFKKMVKETGSPYGLVPMNARPTHRQPNSIIPWYSSDINRLTAPFIMAPVNIKAVHRSSYLVGGYGNNFEYTEQLGLPLTVSG